MSASLDQIATLVLPRESGDTLAEGARVLGLTDIMTLSPGRAIEGSTTAHDSADARAILASARLTGDVCVQPAGDRRRQLLVCDMDSTLIGQECIDELADFAGVKGHVSEITERAMRGEIDFEGALEDRVALLKDLPVSVLQHCFDERIRLNPGARALARTMSRHGANTLIVSGGFTFFTQRVADSCGFAAHQANRLIEADGKLTGRVGYPILGREAKRDALLAACEGQPERALAIGDGANDLAMIDIAGLGLAYYAKPAVAAAAHSAITCTDLRTALYFQGYSDAEIVDD
ncbi:phosphoserine phosphatase SerB [Algimonas porphyrae]|uniref:Phosphoserine phosphatase n=1 Tax=Algimonas porphyrae TaxID=1128113 RepID=A0ABQ5UWN1_9PROT|nr:phosphoserine phosphatase SerB [Algimonas porphyrae]GLQ19314.1 phosphoserine phosphatase SerB [Algimonas porphyrae]